MAQNSIAAQLSHGVPIHSFSRLTLSGRPQRGDTITGVDNQFDVASLPFHEKRERRSILISFSNKTLSRRLASKSVVDFENGVSIELLEEENLDELDLNSYLFIIVDTLIGESQKELNSVKKALASTLRDTLALKRLLMTCQPKLNSSGLLFSYYPSCFPS
ncbi:hypothetical protein SDJN03_18174, partial [Cucurbita argyrosperma subsp. sororia]